MAIAEKRIDVGSLTWFYREVGEGDPVVLLHGLPAHSFTWGAVMPNLAAGGWRAIAPDWPGSGFSSKPDRRDFDYTPAAFQQALGAFLDALDLVQVSLVVQGFLATVGIQYAIAHPDRIHRLAILNSPLVPGMKLPWIMQQWAIPLVGDMLTQDPLLIDRTLEKGSGFVIEDKVLDQYRRPYLQSSDVGRSLLACTKNLQLSQVLPQIAAHLGQEVDTLIVWGEGDPWLGEAPQDPLANRPRLRWEKLKEAQHYPQEHWPKEVSQALLKFL